MPSRSLLTRGLALLLALAASSCNGTRSAQNPTLRITTERGTELGVATTYGPVFLGQTSTVGYVEIEAVYGDGPSIEATVIEPIGGGLFTAETEIRLPEVPLAFRSPRPGEELLLKGRDADGNDWEIDVTVRSDERVYGILLEMTSRLEGHPDQVGAGVYQRAPGRNGHLYLVGLVSGRITLTKDGEDVSYLAVVGPETLYRLVIHRRDHNRRKPWVYREDVL
jgi:hypothetical protein